MRRTLIAGAVLAAVAGAAAAPTIAAPAAPGTGTAIAGQDSLVQQVKRRVIIRRGPARRITVIRPARRVVVVRPWVHRPYYGRIIAGVALGTVIGVAIANAVPVAPSPDLCWYWSSPAHTHGYWDYCY